MKENLIKFISDLTWLNDVKETVSEQEFINICESIAECIDRGYVTPLIGVHYLLDGNISFYVKPAIITDKPHPYGLTDLGRKYLGV